MDMVFHENEVLLKYSMNGRAHIHKIIHSPIKELWSRESVNHVNMVDKYRKYPVYNKASPTS